MSSDPIDSKPNSDNEHILKDNKIKEAVEQKVSIIKDKIVGQLKAEADEPVIPLTPAEEKISNNARTILLALFIMVSFIVALGAWVIIAKPDVSTEVLTIIFSSAITGAFTLGGVLINAIWGKWDLGKVINQNDFIYT